MISEESISKLLVTLKNIGFPEENIEQELREKIALNMRDFSISRSVTFGEENMHFQFSFRQDHENNSVELITCEATHYFPLQIKDDTINGINTLDLEQRMKNIDWKAYFAGTIADESLNDNARMILDDLWKLTSKDWTGKQPQDELVYKYLPYSQWDDDVKRFANFQGYTRSYGYFDDWNIHLCYMEMSGRYGGLIDTLTQIGMREIHTGYIDQLRKDIMTGQKEFDLKVSHNSPDSLSDITIPIRFRDGGYVLEPYSIQQTLYPDIRHGVYNKIDTRALEERLQTINWHDEGALFIFHEDREPEIRPVPAMISEQLYRLREDAAGAEIADLLRLKYFIGITFFEDGIPESAWDMLGKLPQRVSTFNENTPARDAIRLVEGKPVLTDKAAGKRDDNDVWMQYVFDAGNKYHHTELINGYPVGLLEQQLRMLMPTTFLQGIKNQLLFGETAETRSFTGKQILVRADPANKTLRVYDKDKQEIAVNFGLDPDWLTEQAALQNLKNENITPKAAKAILKPKKGPRL